MARNPRVWRTQLKNAMLQRWAGRTIKAVGLEIFLSSALVGMMGVTACYCLEVHSPCFNVGGYGGACFQIDPTGTTADHNFAVINWIETGKDNFTTPGTGTCKWRQCIIVGESCDCQSATWTSTNTTISTPSGNKCADPCPEP